MTMFPSLRTFTLVSDTPYSGILSLRGCESLIAVSISCGREDTNHFLRFLSEAASADSIQQPGIPLPSLQLFRIVPSWFGEPDVAPLMLRRPNIVFEWVFSESGYEPPTLKEACQNAIDLFGERVKGVSERDLRPLWEMFLREDVPAAL